MVERILRFPITAKVKELQRFLGMVNYYREYIPDMSTIADPLHGLLRHSSGWEWDENCQSAFLSLCQMLAGKPIVLSHPNGTNPITCRLTLVPLWLLQSCRRNTLIPVSYDHSASLQH